MNAMIALCHFCEGHGPKILFSCQPFHEDTEDRLSAGSPDSGNGSVAGTAEQKKKFYGTYELLLRSEEGSGEEDEQSCASCQSIHGSLPGFLTNDHDARISYVSSRYPYHPEVFSMVRKACLRSLSCEVGPETEGPIFFGDDELHGYTLCHTFILRDAKARGFQHFYSILIVSMDKLLLLNSYDFLLKCMESVIGRLKKKANQVFDEDQQQAGTLRLATVGRAYMLPTGFLRQRAGSGGSSRSLQELTGDKNVFRFLHRYFVWILKAQTLRTVEFVLEGCPTQDTLVRLEQLEEERAEELDPDLPVHFFPVAPLDLGEVGRPTFFATDEERTALLHREDHLGTPESWEPCADLQEFARSLVPDAFHTFRLILFRLLVGDQIVISGKNRECIRRIINGLMCLIPRGCAKPVFFSSEYQEPFVCNLLGLDAGASPSEHVQERNFLFLASEEDESAKADGTVIGRYRFKVQTGAASPSTLPKLLLRIEQLMWKENLRPNVLEQILVATREEWLNKAKVFYQYYRQHPCPSEQDQQKLMRVIGCGEADKDVIKFWQAGLSKQYKTYVLSTCARLQQVGKIDKKD